MLKASAYCQWPSGSMDLNKTSKWDSLDLNPITGMFGEVEVCSTVRIIAENLDRNGLVSQRSIVTHLLKDLLSMKASKDHGYFLAVTNLKSIGKGEVVNKSGDVLFNVEFKCRTFMPMKGEILQGVVHRTFRHGVLLRCGPVKYIFLSARKMPNYQYTSEENPVFLNDELARIENNVLVRFSVLDVRWIEKMWDMRRDFMMLASLVDGMQALQGSILDDMDVKVVESVVGTHQCQLRSCELGRERTEEENASQLGEKTGKGKTMFLKVQLPWNVIIPAENLDAKGLMLQRSIVVCLLDDFAKKRATKDLGYYLAVSTLESIGEGKVRQQTGDVLFPVVFSGITFKIFKGEILEGVVHKVLKHGVLLRCGPIENIYLSSMKMLDYRYVPGENPVFLNDKTSKIEKDVVVRFVVLGTKWLEAEREFQALVSLEGDYLGPVS
ncbi:hypothetical protein POTOM_037702 [Populus tomentosa]|uniref:DNA-directed RNA polymerase subunit n=2 Tax=Populus TaxID=3689 RepID=A0A8X7YXB3_POPTO|nr:hypothetical protein POTOM_037702 [Populus tomentosa]